MAITQLKSLNPFDFEHPDNWQKWKRRFEQYRHASGLASGSGQSTILYCLGEQAEDILSSTGISVDSRKIYSDAMSKCEEYFCFRKNIIFERAHFNCQNQLPDETAEEYITVLFNLIDSCNYSDLRDEMWCDHLVVGIQDVTLLE